MNVRFLIEAQQDVDTAFIWYEEQVIGLGYDFLDELDQAVRLICCYPGGFMSIDADLKRCYMKRFPFSIVYGVEDDCVIIVAVAHMRRKPMYWEGRVK
ncbi:MAG: type II toxin-antitoxin system RelE/ParE family toxin [Spartobacteria bacterium]|nr:type II toxin-antitoxin system RelE/ParE family toxin [Spartobacteria bacterium]